MGENMRVVLFKIIFLILITTGLMGCESDGVLTGNANQRSNSVIPPETFSLLLNALDLQLSWGVIVDDSANGSNGNVALHNRGGDWGLYAILQNKLKIGRYKISHRYRLTGGSAVFGTYNNSRSSGLVITTPTALKNDGLYHSEVLGYLDVDSNNFPEEYITTYYQPTDSYVLYVEWVKFELEGSLL